MNPEQTTEERTPLTRKEFNDAASHHFYGSRTWPGRTAPENEPHYVVIQGTNIRDTLPGKGVSTPKVYDTEEIAQAAIDAIVQYRFASGTQAIAPRAAISVAEYDEKYGRYATGAEE